MIEDLFSTPDQEDKSQARLHAALKVLLTTAANRKELHAAEVLFAHHPRNSGFNLLGVTKGQTIADGADKQLLVLEDIDSSFGRENADKIRRRPSGEFQEWLTDSKQGSRPKLDYFMRERLSEVFHVACESNFVAKEEVLPESKKLIASFVKG